MAELDDADDQEWAPLFEPTDFNKEHGPLEIEQYRLPQDDLRAWAERCVKLRATIAGNAKRQADGDPEDQLVEEPGRHRKGHKWSKRQHNAEGVTEALL